MTNPPANPPEDPNALGIYIHWPFCQSKCPYCDFNSHVRETVDDQLWQTALIDALDEQAEALAGRVVQSIFFGGGTPSLMPPATVGRLLDRIGAHWQVAEGLEVSFEANPSSVEAARFRGYRTAGVNRLSLGVQSLRDEALVFLGRQHDSRQARGAIELARRIFPRYSFDLIYARPNQTPQDWACELQQAIALAGDHLSLYQLTIEAGTAFHTRVARGDFAVPAEDQAGELYELTQEILTAAGLPAYEISNHARAPHGASRHNLLYWRYGDYLGIGPGAHGRLTLAGVKWATRQHKAPERWLTAAGRTAERQALSTTDRLTEMLMMGLRLNEPIPHERFQRECAMPLEAALSASALASLIEGGFLTLTPTGLGSTASGRQRLNSVLAHLLAG